MRCRQFRQLLLRQHSKIHQDARYKWFLLRPTLALLGKGMAVLEDAVFFTMLVKRYKKKGPLTARLSSKAAKMVPFLMAASPKRGLSLAS